MTKNREGVVILPILVIVLLLGTIGVFAYQNFNLRQRVTKTHTPPNTLQNSSAPTETAIAATSVTEALTKSSNEGIICIRQVEDGMQKGIAYIRNGKLRFEGGNLGLMTVKTARGIYKDDTLWVWVPGEKEGTIMNLQGNTSINLLEEIASGLDEDRQICQFATVEEVLFEPPVDVDFVM